MLTFEMFPLYDNCKGPGNETVCCIHLSMWLHVCVCAYLLEVAKRQLSIKWLVNIFKWFVLLVDEMFV